MAGTGALGAAGERTPADLAPLRAIDWRFLLPAAPATRFRRLAIFGGPAGTPARAALSGLADDISTDPAVSSADVVAAYADAPQSITRIVRTVSRDGVLYLEIDRNRGGVRATTPARVEAALQEAGLRTCARYTIEPTLASPRAFIPLGVPQATSWHRRTSLGDRPAMRLANAVRQAAARVGGPTVAALDRAYAVVAVGSGCDGGAPGTLRDAEVLQRLGASTPPAGAAMLTYGGDRVLLFPFHSAGTEPFAVVKVAKAPALFDRTQNEQAHLRSLRATLHPELANAIPDPLGVVHWPGGMAACERYISGMTVASRAMDRQRSSADKVGDLQLAMSWLARFHRATETGRATVGESREPFVDRLLDAFHREVGSRDTATLLAAIRSASATLGTATVAMTTEHRDFAAWNVIRRESDVAVVDWEGARQGFGAFDAVHLATTWLYCVRHSQGSPDEQRCVHDLLRRTAPDAAGAAARDAVAWYLRALDFDIRLAPLLIVLHRIELALRRETQRRLHGDAEGDGNAEVRIVRSLTPLADHLLAAAPA